MKRFDMMLSYLRFSVAAGLLTMTAVAVFFGIAANQARSIARYNQRLTTYIDRSHQENTLSCFVGESKDRGIERFVGGALRKELQVVTFARNGDPATCLDDLGKLGVRKIGYLDYSFMYEEMAPSPNGISLLPEFEISAVSIGCEMNTTRTRTLTSVKGLHSPHIHDRYGSDWLTNDLLAAMSPNDSLMELTLSGQQLTEDCLPYLDRFPYLIHLDVQMTSIEKSKSDEYQKQLFTRASTQFNQENTVRSYFRFSVAAVLLMMTAVAVVLRIAANRARKNARSNGK
ncbi:MAG: hypothetical protein Aurels2KO_22790 [Aureliella sp.]